MLCVLVYFDSFALFSMTFVFQYSMCKKILKKYNLLNRNTVTYIIVTIDLLIATIHSSSTKQIRIVLENISVSCSIRILKMVT